MRSLIICPKCYSCQVNYDFSIPAAVAFMHFQHIKQCQNCGHTGMFFPKVPVRIIPPVQRPKQRTYVDISLGKGIIWVILFNLILKLITIIFQLIIRLH